MGLQLGGGRLETHLVSARVDFIDALPVVHPHVWPEAIAMHRNVTILALLPCFFVMTSWQRWHLIAGDLGGCWTDPEACGRDPQIHW